MGGESTGDPLCILAKMGDDAYSLETARSRVQTRIAIARQLQGRKIATPL
jgi:hypothetical protein